MTEVTNIKTFNNQKLVQIHKVNSGTTYKAQQDAYKVLGSNASKLYSHLVAHSQDKLWALSRAEVIKNANLTEKTYRTAVKELIDKGFLVEGGITTEHDIISKNAYHFYESPELVIPTPKPVAETVEFVKPTPKAHETPAPKKNTNPRGGETTKIPLPEDYIKLLQSVDTDKLIKDGEAQFKADKERLEIKRKMKEAEANYLRKPYIPKGKFPEFDRTKVITQEMIDILKAEEAQSTRMVF